LERALIRINTNGKPAFGRHVKYFEWWFSQSCREKNIVFKKRHNRAWQCR